MSKTRAIRFTAEEESQIDEFLRVNPFFDFSTLAKISILSFVKDPKITIRAVPDNKIPNPNRRKNEQPEQ